jgi:hypothetical protein
MLVEDTFLGRTRVGKAPTAAFGREGVLEKWLLVFQAAFSAKNLPGPLARKNGPTDPILGGKKSRRNTTRVIIDLYSFAQKVADKFNSKNEK